MKKYAILTFMERGMSTGTAPNESSPARLNIGKYNDTHSAKNGLAADLIKDENGNIIQFVSQVAALNYCVERGWTLQQTIFESGYGFNDRDPLSSFIFVLSKEE